MEITYISQPSQVKWIFPKFSFGIQYATKQIPVEGWLAWEYNPFHNFVLSEDIIQVSGKSEKLSLITNEELEEYFSRGGVLKQAGTLVDLDTPLLQFNIHNSVQVECQTSFDGSTNVIFTDNMNTPRLINSRFTPLEGNRYTIVDRYGNNDTNIYDENSFDIESRLFSTYRGFPTIELEDIVDGGSMLCGSYVFYFRFCNADGDETDIVAQTPNIQLTKGTSGLPQTMQSGYQNENTFKMVRLRINDTLNNYDYITISYSRITSDEFGSPLREIWKIDKKFPMTSKSIVITGNEDKDPLTEDDINERMMIIRSAKTSCQFQNMLFFGNIGRSKIYYNELTNLSLRLLPTPVYKSSKEEIGELDEMYYAEDETKAMYFNTMNAYEKTGYFPNEIYRFGIVYVLHDGTYTFAFPIRGGFGVKEDADDINSDNHYSYQIKDGVKSYDIFEEDIDINEESYMLNNANVLFENSRGVCRFAMPTEWDDSKGMPLMSIRIKFRKEWLDEVHKYAKGFMIVRQKRKPLTLCQGLSIGVDSESGIPMLDTNDGYITESIINESGKLSNSYYDRLINPHDETSIKQNGILCPEAIFRKSTIKQVINGNECVLTESWIQPSKKPQSYVFNRSYVIPMSDGYKYNINNSVIKSKLHCIDEANVMAYDNNGKRYKKYAGSVEYPEDYESPFMKIDSVDYDGTKKILRGIYSDYIASEEILSRNTIYNICIPGFSENNMRMYYDMRVSDKSPFYAISDIFDPLEMSGTSYAADDYSVDKEFYNGDCYICQVTLRMLRNFNDPENPANDKIVDYDTWINYWQERNKEEDGMGKKLLSSVGGLFGVGSDQTDSSSVSKLNSGDINAVQLGHWITFTLYTSNNLIRTDHMGFLEEASMMGNFRSFYPYRGMATYGNFKMDDSDIVNMSMGKSASVMSFRERPDVPYLKEIFQTRVAFSAIHNTDGYSNKYRYFYPKQYYDLPIIYGGITKLVEYGSNIICVFEHAIALLSIQMQQEVNRNCIAGVTMLSNTYGSQWIDSIVKSGDGSQGDMGCVYGVDTVSKVIWQIQGSTVNVISNMKVDRFLNDNITFGERELEMTMGIRNVKSHYNHNKRDIMFTFYDNLEGFEETSWNLCYNEAQQKFATFYSWIPSMSENIDTMYFSFNRDTAKNIAKLWISGNDDTSYIHTYFRKENGLPVPESAIVKSEDDIIRFDISKDRVAENADFIDHIPTEEEVYAQFQKNRIYYTVKYELERDNAGNYLNFLSGPSDDFMYDITNGLKWQGKWDANTFDWRNTPIGMDKNKVYLINVKATIEYYYYKGDINIKDYVDNKARYMKINAGFYEQVIAIAHTDCVNGYWNNINNKYIYPLATDFWKHGMTGNIDICEPIKPAFWYGKQHPFEFEYTVTIDRLCSFNNLNIMSNEVAPESFHVTWEADSYEFRKDYKNEYFRQEATKSLYQYNYHDILYNKKFFEHIPEQRMLKYRPSYPVADKSVLFPLFYSRVDTYNEIEDSYQHMISPSRNYQYMAGTEVVYDRILNDYGLSVHVKANPIGHWYKQYITNETASTPLYKDKAYVEIGDDCIAYSKASDSDKKNNRIFVWLQYDRFRGNCWYRDSVWSIQLPSFPIYEINEPLWSNINTNFNSPIINTSLYPLPFDRMNKSFDIPKDLVKLNYNFNNGSIINNNNWLKYRKDIRILGKNARIKLRYTGDKLVLIREIETKLTAI